MDLDWKYHKFNRMEVKWEQLFYTAFFFCGFCSVLLLHPVLADEEHRDDDADEAPKCVPRKNGIYALSNAASWRISGCIKDINSCKIIKIVIMKSFMVNFNSGSCQISGRLCTHSPTYVLLSASCWRTLQSTGEKKNCRSSLRARFQNESLRRQQVCLLSWVSPRFNWQEKHDKNTVNQIRDELVF